MIAFDGLTRILVALLRDRDAGLEIKNWPSVEAWLTRLSSQEGWQHPDDLMT